MSSSNDMTDNPEKNNEIQIKKSTFNKILTGIIIAIAVAAFFGGYIVGIETTRTDGNVMKGTNEIIGNAQESTRQENSQPIQVSSDDDPVMGNPNAEIILIEFSDFQCPFCARFHENTLPLIESNYINTGKVKFVYRDFPIISIHPNALPAALAAECADDQGKFWEYHDLLFNNQKNWEKLEIKTAIIAFKQYASQLGLNSDSFDPCLESGKYLEEVNRDLEDGRIYGVTGTPGFFIGNDKIGYTKIEGAKPFEIFQSEINRLLSN